eukprot:TRINITY_DN22842_c0_g1_i1.p1 TRINITY_DN22842_c0_g1~~TRINITY_DN22842_c0_g1_i1.p1  ORF type:complete len:496 (+),score=152.32 TRINITY_DN22842_c0_g1_i1:62-1489(+)
MADRSEREREPLLPKKDELRFSEVAASLVVPVYVPNALYLVSHGAALVVIPLYIISTLGLPYMYVGAYKVVQELAELAANNPASYAVSNWGWKTTAAIGAASFTCSSLLLWVSAVVDAERHALLCLFLLAFFAQCASVKFFHRSNTLLTSRMRSHYRGRHSSILAGTQYAMASVGPFVAVHVLGGEPDSVFLAMTGVGACAALSTLAGMLGQQTDVGMLKPRRRAQAAGLLAGGSMRSELLKFALPCFTVVMLRGGFHLLVPILSVQLGLGATAVATVFVASNAVALSLFWVGGQVLDRLGRKWAAIPACIMFTAAFAILGTATSHHGMAAAGIAFGLGETVCAGIKHSLKADFVARAYQHGMEQRGADALSEEEATAFSLSFGATLDNLLDFFALFYPMALSTASQFVGPSDVCYVWAVLAALGTKAFASMPETLVQQQDGRTETALRVYLLVVVGVTVLATVWVIVVQPSWIQ